MILYAESSAVLSWLLGEPRGSVVAEKLALAERIVASDLTLVECDRALHRATGEGKISEAAASDRRAVLAAAASSWVMLRVGNEVVERARRPYPVEPVRTLDALHIASALTARSAMAQLEMLSLDDRVRACAQALGFALQPDAQHQKVP